MIFNMVKAQCSNPNCRKTIDVWIIPGEVGTYWCGPQCRLNLPKKEDLEYVVNERGSGTSGEGSPTGGEESFENEGGSPRNRPEAGVDETGNVQIDGKKVKDSI